MRGPATCKLDLTKTVLRGGEILKLRLRDDSMRLRLTRSEVAALAQGGAVESCTRFGPDRALRFAVVSGSASTVSFTDSVITVRIAGEALDRWAASEELACGFAQSWQDGSLRVLIEKDLACAKPRPGDDNSDAFPALAGQGHCL
jgi:hypothetical protein